MSQEERKKFESLKSDFNKYWIPCVWFTNLAAQARKDGRIRDDIALCLLLEVSQLRTGLCTLSLLDLQKKSSCMSAQHVPEPRADGALFQIN